MSIAPARTWAVRLAACAAVLSFPADARADVVTSTWTDADDYDYRVVHMPDFDQRRTTSGDGSILGLPNDGAMYCAPTSAMNLTAYIAAHGFPAISPGVEAWQSPGTYGLATGSLQIFGLIMATDPTNGTSLDGWYNGLRSWLPEDQFTVNTNFMDGVALPRLQDLALSAINGGLLVCGYGFYETVGFDGGVPIISRNGGHCITPVGIHAGFVEDSLYVRDPADDDVDLLTQSTFTDRKLYAYDVTVEVDGDQLTMTRLDNTPGKPTGKYLDGYIQVRPKAGYTLTDLGIQIHYTASLWGALAPGDITLPVPPGTISDLLMAPNLNNVFFTVLDGGTYRIWRGSIQTSDLVPFAGIELAQPPRLSFGFNRRLYYTDGDDIVMVNPDPADPEEIVRTTIAGPFDAIAFDDGLREIILLDAAHQMIHAIPWHMDGVPRTRELSALPLSPPASMTWDPDRRAAWIVSPASSSILRVPTIGPPPTTLALPGVVAPTAVDVDDAGHLLVTEDGAWRVFAEDPPGSGTWTEMLDAPLEGWPVGSVARVTRSRSNFDFDIHGTPGWRNVLPEEFGEATPDCPEDLDLSGDVGFADLLLVVGDWGDCPDDAYCAEDFDFSGDVGFADLLHLIGEWGDCP